MIGVSPALVEIARLVRKLAPTSASVLIQGETGTGKEVVARAVHELGGNAERPFVVVDCGSLPPTLIASELFGHERGAFTGAESQRAGAFERAHGGTVFLDEVGELPLDVQPVLLGALERRRFRRLGGRHEIEVDVRVLAATNRDLRAEVNAGTFRADLYYRLAVARVVIPPLRERPEDIEPLVAHFVQQLTGALDGVGFGSAALAAMSAHRWSGNVRELRNVVEAALAVGTLKLEHDELGAPLAAAEAATALAPYREARAEALARFERGYLGELIKQCGGNASQAARRAAMDRPYLLNLLRRHGLR
ncbi:MAG: sigma-54-dependent Fis family transcriptional regulator [Proteobacteria bacterium]|nr:sigma-54-dependent Fis family transcriptional regulator [Pseudomonadota bacterium]